MKSVAIDIPTAALERFCRKHRIRRMALFGSVLREDFSSDSDVDVLVDFEPGARVGLIRFAGMENELSELLNRRVDLHTPNSLSAHLREEVLSEAESIYDAAR